MKLKVSQIQYDYYATSFSDFNLIKRIMREFDLDYFNAQIIQKGIEADIDEVFEVVPGADYPPLPSHPQDTRQLVFLPKEEFVWLQEALENQLEGRHLTELKGEERREILKAMTDRFYPTLSTRAKDRLAHLGDGYFMTARELGVALNASLDEVRGWLESQIENGADLLYTVIEFLGSLDDPDEVQRIVAYAAAADILYDAAEAMLETKK